MHSQSPLILASGSEIRAKLLESARLNVEIIKPRVDEQSIKAALLAEGTSPRDVADVLAESKARKVAQKCPEALVLGCDQTLELKGKLYDKPESQNELIEHLNDLSGQTHKLHSAAVVYEDGKPVWRHIGSVTLTMRPLSTSFIEDYVARNWPRLSQSLGGYKLEEEGSRLFVSIRGEYHDVLGLPLLPLLNWLTLKGVLDS